MAVLITMAMLGGGGLSKSDEREKKAREILAGVLRDAGWKLSAEWQGVSGHRSDFVVTDGHESVVIEVKAASEGRTDRLIPLWSQAYLQAARLAELGGKPMAVVVAPAISASVAEQVLEFAESHAPDAPSGVMDLAGSRWFRGGGFNILNAEPPKAAQAVAAAPREGVNLFTDLNQWLLKLLVAPEVPREFLNAPRGRYSSASDLARAADVSVMTASRLVRQLEREGYLDESSTELNLVRREELFAAWQRAASRGVKEAGFKTLFPGKPVDQLGQLFEGGAACIGLFAAADQLGVGFVQGVPTHLYVEKLANVVGSAWRSLRPAEEGERPNVLIREAPAQESIFRGAVTQDGVLVTDIVQVWLDVASHPTRGHEQADLIRRKVLGRVIRGS